VVHRPRPETIRGGTWLLRLVAVFAALEEWKLVEIGAIVFDKGDCQTGKTLQYQEFKGVC
jgi:hypothetical protein